MKVNDAAVVAIVAHRDIHPMIILPFGDDDLVTGGMDHHGAVAAGGTPVNAIAERCGVLGQIDPPLEVFQLIPAAGLRLVFRHRLALGSLNSFHQRLCRLRAVGKGIFSGLRWDFA